MAPPLRYPLFILPGPEELKFAVCSSRGATLEDLMQKRLQELWGALTVETQGLHSSLSQKEASLENLSAEVLERWVAKREEGKEPPPRGHDQSCS